MSAPARWQGYPLAALAGVLYCLGFPGVGLWPLSLFFAWPLWWLLDRAPLTWRRALGLGGVFGFVTHAGGYYWMPETLTRFAGLSWAAAFGVSVLLFVYQGGQLALLFSLWARARRLGHDVLWMSPLSLAAVELVYPLLFPSYLANSASALWLLAQPAELGGPTLVSALWLGVSACLYAVLVRRRVGGACSLRAVAAFASVALVLWGVGAWRALEVERAAGAASRLVVGLVQANLGHDDKGVDEAGDVARHVALSRRLLAARKPDLLVWPEAVLQRPVARRETSLAARVPPLETPLLVGALTWGRAGLQNSALLADGDGRVIGRAHKVRLLPFAEYVPLEGALPWLRRLAPAAGRLAASESPRALSLGDARLGTLICYEDVLPGLVRQLMRVASPQLLVNLTNDAWFGDTTEPRIHLALARLRAIEQRRYLVRATNSGITAVIDPLGRVIAERPAFAPAVLAVEVPLLDGTTAYRALGDWPGLVALCALPLPLWRRRRVPRATADATLA